MSAAPKIASPEASERGSPVVVIGADLRVSFANELAHRQLGYAAGGLHRVPAESLFPPSHRGVLQNARDVFKGQTGRRVRSPARGRDGRAVDVEMVFEPCLDAEGSVSAVSLRLEAPRSTPSGRPRARFGTPAPISGTHCALSEVAPRASGLSTNCEAEAPEARGVAGPSGDEELETAMQLLCWLDAELSQPGKLLSLADPRERARILTVLGEVRSAVENCAWGLKTPS